MVPGGSSGSLGGCNSEDGHRHPEHATRSVSRAPRGRRHRWSVLVLACIIPLGSHFVRKSLGPLKTAMLADHGLALDNTRFAMLLSATAFPNLLFPIFGGALLDMRGSRWGTLLFVVVTLIGQVFFAMAAHIKIFYALVAAQILVGVGSGSTVVSQAAISSEYFQDTEIGFAIGIIESAHNLSNWMGQALPAQIVALVGVSYLSGLWAGGGMRPWDHVLWPFIYSLGFLVVCCFVSLLAAILYIFIDLKAETDEFKTSASRLSRISNPITPDHRPSMWSQFKLPRGFFGLAILHMLFSTAHESFDNLSANLLTVRYGDSAIDAGLLASIDNALGLVAAPFVGILLDHLGHRLHFIMFMAILLSAAQGLLAFTRVNPLIPLIMLGIVNSTVPTILRSSVPLVVDPFGWGTAFGVFEAFEACGTFSGNLAAGFLRDWTSTYVGVNIIFASFGVVCFSCSMVMELTQKEISQLLRMPLDPREPLCPSNHPSDADMSRDQQYGSFGSFDSILEGSDYELKLPRNSHSRTSV